jgi:hypothetical protein
MRDVSRSSRSVARVAMDACGVSASNRAGENVAAYGEIVWSWRRDPGVYPPRLCGDGNGDNKGRSPGRARISRKAIARGRPGCLGCTCQTRVRFFTTHCTRCCGRSRRPAFPAPSVWRGPTKLHNSGEIAPRECFPLFEKLIQQFQCRPGLVRNCARGPGPITTNAHGTQSWSDRASRYLHRWLWVPACAGTTSACFALAYRLP